MRALDGIEEKMNHLTEKILVTTLNNLISLSLSLYLCPSFSYTFFLLFLSLNSLTALLSVMDPYSDQRRSKKRGREEEEYDDASPFKRGLHWNAITPTYEEDVQTACHSQSEPVKQNTLCMGMCPWKSEGWIINIIC